MKILCQENLRVLRKLLQQLSNEQYHFPSRSLFGATIGQHIRHILEFYQSVLNGLETKTVNYDLRNRNLLIETDTLYAIQIIDEINANLQRINLDKKIMLEGNFCANDNGFIQIQSSFYRELAYCLEHSIHHQALIKVGLAELNSLSYIDDTFGLAPATIRYRNQCAQ